LGKNGVLVIYLNLNNATAGSPYPRRDDLPFELLKAGGSREEYENIWAAFFSAFFSVCKEELAELDANNISLESLANKWYLRYGRFDSVERTEFLRKLKEKFNRVRQYIFP
jgi:hypothetical protein